jgi:hypothetical protein
MQEYAKICLNNNLESGTKDTVIISMEISSFNEELLTGKLANNQVKNLQTNEDENEKFEFKLNYEDEFIIVPS